MATVSSVSGSQSASQLILQQLRLQQAQRNADQAQQTAQALQQQANNAQIAANQAEATANSLNSQASQAQSNAGQAQQGLAAVKALGQFQTQQTATLQAVSNAEVKTPAVQTAPPAPPQTTPQVPAHAVVNTQGNVTGTIINVTA